MKNTKKTMPANPKNEILSLLIGEDDFNKKDILETLEFWGVITIVLIFVSILS